MLNLQQKLNFMLERGASPMEILNKKLKSSGLVSNQNKSDYISRHELINLSQKKKRIEKPLIFRGNQSLLSKNQFSRKKKIIPLLKK